MIKINYSSKKLFILGMGSSGQRYSFLASKLIKKKNIIGIRRNIKNAFSKTPYQKFVSKNINCINYSDVKEQIKHSDKLIICTPNIFHFEDYLNLREFFDGDILIEKPLCINQKNYVKAKKINDEKCWISFQYRYIESLKILKNILNIEKNNGYHLRIYHSDDVRYWHTWEKHNLSYSCRDDLGGGAYNTLNHALDIANYLLGIPKSSSIIKTQISNYTYNCDDAYEGVMIFPKSDKIKNICSVGSNYASPNREFSLVATTYDKKYFLNLLNGKFFNIAYNENKLLQKIIIKKGYNPKNIREKLFLNLLIDFLDNTKNLKCPHLKKAANFYSSLNIV